MDLALSGKIVVVTGGASGIGEAIVQALAAEGALPVIVDKDEDAGHALRNSLNEGGLNCESVTADLVEEGACEEAIDKSQQRWTQRRSERRRWNGRTVPAIPAT
jgi:L-fucose dehydrogenase